MLPPTARAHESEQGRPSFVSLPRRGQGDDPDTATETNEQGEVMRSGRNYRRWSQSLAKLKEKWPRFTSGLFLAIAEEEMKIRREELENHVGGHGQPCAPPIKSR